MNKIKLGHRIKHGVGSNNIRETYIIYEDKCYKLNNIGFLFKKTLSANPIGEKKAFYHATHGVFIFNNVHYVYEFGKKTVKKYIRKDSDLFSVNGDSLWHEEAVLCGLVGDS